MHVMCQKCREKGAHEPAPAGAQPCFSWAWRTKPASATVDFPAWSGDKSSYVFIALHLRERIFFKKKNRKTKTNKTHSLSINVLLFENEMFMLRHHCCLLPTSFLFVIGFSMCLYAFSYIFSLSHTHTSRKVYKISIFSTKVLCLF